MAVHLLRSIAFVVLAAQGLGDAGSPADAPPRVVYTDAPAGIVEMAEWAVALFDEAGMELPPVEFVYHGDLAAPCGGEGGLHLTRPDRHLIELCRTDLSFVTQATVLHEFAHAWAAHDADSAALVAFQELRGYEHWNDHGRTPWYENGTEQAAEIIVWGLVDRPMGIVRITQNSCDDLHAGFVTLTGRQPLHGFRDLCG